MANNDIQTLSPQRAGGSPQPIKSLGGNEATFTKTNTSKSSPKKLLGFFGSFFEGSIIKKAITFIVIFFVLKMTVFR